MATTDGLAHPLTGAKQSTAAFRRTGPGTHDATKHPIKKRKQMHDVAPSIRTTKR